METVTIHPAETNDLQALCGLYIWFHEFRIRGLPDRLRSLREAEQRDDSWIIEGLEKIMADGNAVILVAENSQNLVGLSHIIMRQDASSATTFSCKYGHLQSLFVLENNRRQGLGSQLLDYAEQWAREKGAAEIRLETWDFADGSLAFYEGLGYKTLRRTLCRALPAWIKLLHNFP